jgi:hypothetical protein
MTGSAKQSIVETEREMDCFAAIAMTVGTRLIEICADRYTNAFVMPGLDPGIHPSSQEASFEADGLPGQARQ